MARAIAKNTRVAFVAEVTPGTTPTSPVFTVARVTGESLVVEREHVFSGELDGRRGQKNFAISRARGSGGLEGEWSDNTWEPLLQSVLRNTWSTDVLVDANAAQAFTLETTFETGATDVFKRLVGAEANTFQLNLTAGEIATCSFGFLARSSAFATAIVSGATYTAAGSDPIILGADFGSLTMDGLTVGCVSALTLNVNNNLSPEECLGSLNPTGMGAGTCEVSGTLSVYLDDMENDILAAYADGVATSIDFRLGKGTGTRTRFEMPNVILSDMQVAAESQDGSVLMQMNWRALQASSLSGSVIRITRNTT